MTTSISDCQNILTPECSSFDIYIDQGGTWMLPIILSENVILIKSTLETENGTIIELIAAHNYQIGDPLIIIHDTTCTAGNVPLCGTVIGIPDCKSVEVDLKYGGSGGANGFVSRPIDLSGYYFKGEIKNRHIPTGFQRLLGASVSGIIGDKLVLMRGYFDVKVGDTISIPSMGIQNASILAIYSDCQDEPEVKYDECGNICLSHDSSAKALLLSQEVATTQIDACDASITSTKLADIEITPYDNICGSLILRVKGSQTQNFGIGIAEDPNCNVCNDFYYEYARYNLFAKRGYGNRVPSHYCHQSPTTEYDTDIFLVGVGKVWVRPSWI